MFSFRKDKLLSEISSRIVEFLDDGVVVIDSSYQIVFFNKSAEGIFGYSSQEAIGQPLNLLLPERSHLKHNVMLDDFIRGTVNSKMMGERDQQIMAKRKGGEEFISEISILKLPTYKGYYYAAIIRDVSENKKTEEELLRLASTDPLTGAFNRREFTALAEQEAIRSNRYGHPLSIMMIDLDHFKHLNDTYGHAAGDKALQRFTTLCCNALRNIDVFGRWGGEEFVALLPETDAEGAAIIAERLRKSIGDNVLNFNGQKIKITVSIGIAEYKAGEKAVDAPLGRADKAVYEAKKMGRNRVSIYTN